VRPILVLAAVDTEARSLARRLGLAAAPGSDCRWGGGALQVACVGLRATRLALVEPPVASLVVSAGVCGALAPQLEAGSLVVPETVVAADGARQATAVVPGLPRRGALLSVADVVPDGAAKARLWLETGALAVDMESAIILAWAAARGLSAAVVRGVADTAARGVPVDLAGVVADDGRVRPLRAVTAVLARPGAVADALALRRGTVAALTAVAAALARLAQPAARA
jgi:adenosylhomocysteine nucleosidase